MLHKRELTEDNFRDRWDWLAQGASAPQLLPGYLSTLRRHAGASAACLWIRADGGMRLHAADPCDLPLGEVLPVPGGAIAETADDGVLRFVTDPSQNRGFHQIPLLEDRIRSAAVAILPVGRDRPPLPAVVCLHLSQIPDDPTHYLFEWVRWTHLLDLFLPAAAGNDIAAQISGPHPPAGPLGQNLSLQAISGGLARRINERLSTVLPALQQARRLLREEDPALRFLQYVEEGLDRTQGLLAKLQAYAGNGPLIAETVSVADCAAEAVRRLEPQRPAQVRLTASIPAGLPTIVADRVQVVAAIMEVVCNGLEAAPDGTGVKLKVEQEGEGILITVTDEGVGMTQEVLEQATQPFFSSKHPAEHPGLGLSTTQGCIYRHGGRLTLSSQVGTGTRVAMWFPLQAHPPVA